MPRGPSGLRNLPLHHTAQNQLWLEIVQIARDLLAWMPMLALAGETRGWGPAVFGSVASPPQPRSSPSPTAGT